MRDSTQKNKKERNKNWEEKNEMKFEVQANAQQVGLLHKNNRKYDQTPEGEKEWKSNRMKPQRKEGKTGSR